jgi:hypothetical protein
VPTALIAALVVLVTALGITALAAHVRDHTPKIPDGLLALAAHLEQTWPAKQAALLASGVPLNDIIDRAGAEALMPEDVSNAMLTNLSERAEGSAVLQTFNRVPVARGQTRFPVLQALPIAYWVNGDTGQKQTTEVSWDNKFLDIEELAVIVPIPENVLDDSSIPIWEQVQPLCEEAAARLIDTAVYFGANAPANFPDDVVTSAIAAGNVVARGTNDAAHGGIVGDHSAVLTALEDDGFDATGGVATRRIRGPVRQARNVQGDRFGEIAIDKDGVEIDGVRYMHTMRGLWPVGASQAELIATDGTQFVVGVRQDITWKFLDQAVIQDAQGNIVYNLPQQDMVAMRMKMRLGWQVANTINYDQPVEGSRYPAAVLRSPA